MSKNDLHSAEKLDVRSENQFDLNSEFNKEERNGNDEDGI